MNIIYALLNKEIIKLKRSIIFYISIFLLFPLLLYLFYSIPLSLVFKNMKPIYMVWSSGGIWVLSSLFLTYLLSDLYINNCYNNESMKSFPILSYHYLFAGYIYALVIGLTEFIISIIITSSITSYYISIIHFFKIILILSPAIIMIYNISFLINKICSQSFSKNISNILIFLILSFGMGSFIPLNLFPESYMNLMLYMPFASTIYNVQNIISNEPIFFSLLFSSIFYVIIFTLLNYFAIENNIAN